MISVKNLSLTIQDGRNNKELFQNLNLCLNAGQKIAIMGKSGSGKTTLLKALSGLIKTDKGTILFEGNDLRNMTANELSLHRLKNIGFIFQDNPMIASKNILDNIALPLKYLRLEKKMIENKVHHLAEKLAIQDLLLEKPTFLSGGERQRAGIARALITEPKLILADEPTGSLDFETEAIVLDIFQKIKLIDTSFVMVTHDPAVANICDNVYTLNDKQLHIH
ncbi:ABC transporter ATP-binding protein [Enterococcus alcedinis]|uniref:ABC transporter ATP-binding protein n=1 Tax=Enterococcus alcedinis TaxID=1274384 RepID=A0A917JER0_9ENTE|nr:ABC transporter ATP-binding protein [Enterococcus alcedinis]MBP2101869.1 putative ABC transport system ATP-binding protein [Enterococcus alcedinis]GGI65431.1 ABC transporter ATP-binding protein [Enterococcus alcedinis]